MKVIVSGYMVRHPVTGNILAFLHYVLGLCRLGHEVVYMEESGWSDSCYQPSTGMYSRDPEEGLQIVSSLMRRFDVRARVCYLDRDSGASHGCSRTELEGHLASADLLINVGGACSLAEFALCSRRVFIDMDPLFTQLGRFGAEDLEDYHVHFSYGANIGMPECTIPDAQITWLPTHPPVVPDIWSRRQPNEWADMSRRPMTTIGNWSAYGAIERDGVRYGQKDEEFLKLVDLPRRTKHKLELALSGAGNETVELLTSNGWTIRDADRVTSSWNTYASYIRRSRGEFSVAKNGYVKTVSGWFSDRSVCYLAAGRPVVLQDTGVDRWLPRNPAVLTFATLEEAVNCLDELPDDYSGRCRCAREIAGDFFSHTVVLPRLLENAFRDCSAAPAEIAGAEA